MAVYSVQKIVNISKFENEIRASSMTATLVRVTIFGDLSYAEFEEELSTSDLQVFQMLADNHEPVCLQEAKETKLEQLDIDTRQYILSKYSLERQSSLALIRGDARADGLTNRFAYVQQVVDWTNSVLMYHYTVSDQIAACTSIAALADIVVNYPANSMVDPNVTIREAMAIND